MATANTDGPDEQPTSNGYRGEFDVPDYVPSDYDGPVAREDSRGDVRRLCLVETNGTGKPCSNYMDTCRFHDHTLGELKPADERPDRDNGAPLKLVTNDKNEKTAIEGAKDGLRLRDISALLSTTRYTLMDAIDRGKAVHDVPDSELSDKELRFKSFFNRFKRAWGVGTERLVKGALHDDDVDTQAATFMLERSRDFIKTERHEVDQTVREADDENEGYEVVDDEGRRAHPDRSREARRKRNQQAQQERQAESDDENAPIPVESQTIDNSGAGDANDANDAKQTTEEREQRESSEKNNPPSENQPLTGRVPDDDGADQ
jgi:hypothetical protein